MISPIEKARCTVFKWYERNGYSNRVKFDDVYTVWFCYILGGWKALCSTTLDDNRYFEVTYNVNRDEIYLDVYEKRQNEVCNSEGEVK